MRTVLLRFSTIIGMLILAAACTDLPTEPAVPATAAYDELEGCVSDGYCVLPPISSGGGCDPTITECDDGGWDTCITTAPGTAEPGTGYISGCPGGGTGPGGDGGGSSGGGGSAAPPNNPGECNPNTNPDCLQPLSAWDKETLRQGFARHLRTAFTDPAAAEMCNLLATQFHQMVAAGRVGRGAFGSTGEPGDPLHVAAYDRAGGTIHFEPDAMAAANAGDPTAVRNLVNSALHEAGHSLDYTHTDPVWMGNYDLYAEPPFSLLSPGTNSCITNW